MVLADDVQIQQVVLNLTRNAIEAMEEVGIANGVINVGVMAIAEKEVVVSVADCGSGIAPDEMERIFEPFYSTKGLGVGYRAIDFPRYRRSAWGALDCRSQCGRRQRVPLHAAGRE